MLLIIRHDRDAQLLLAAPKTIKSIQISDPVITTAPVWP